MKAGLKIKVCGMRDPDNIRRVEALGVDMMGFIFYPRSPRHVGSKPSYLPTACRRVGVFVDAGIDDIAVRAEGFKLSAVQLHGAETPDFCETLRRRLGAGVDIIKALSAKDTGTLLMATDYEGAVDMLLFDTPCAGYGGSGRGFDWSMLDSYQGTTPFLLSGGIGPGAAAAIDAVRHPALAGIDLNSRFETEPVIKDIDALNQFINEIRQLS